MRIRVEVPYHYWQDRVERVRRTATFDADVACVPEDEAPVVAAFERRGARHAAEYRFNGGSFYVDDRSPKSERGVPTIRYGAPEDRYGFNPGKPELAESPEDVESADEMREEEIAAARAWATSALVRQGADGSLVCMARRPEPLIAALSPEVRDCSDLTGQHGSYKIPYLQLVLLDRDLDDLRGNDLDQVRYLLREDRLFHLDEMAEAVERSKQSGKRVHMGRGLERLAGLNTLSMIRADLSATALRLTAGDLAWHLDGRRVSAEVETALAGLRAVVRDAGANAAVFCPAARSLSASFASSPEMLKLSENPQIATALARLGRAHERSQRRMAEGRIPDRDPRALAPEDDVAMGHLGP